MATDIMNGQLFPQTVIAILWDFDKTLCPGYMQEPLFSHYGIDPDRFWNETNALAARYQADGLHHVSYDTMYLNHLLSYVQAGTCGDLNNALLRHLGAGIRLHPGVPEIFERLKAVGRQQPGWQRCGISIEHYIISNGLYEMIMGSSVAEHVDGVWACEFIERPHGPGLCPLDGDGLPVIRQLGYVLDNTTKTRAIFEINKGSNTDTNIDVNAALSGDQRRVPMDQMIYVADGPTDIPGFSLVRKNGGYTYAVYQDGDAKAFNQARDLNDQQRVNAFGAADYRPGSQTAMWLESSILAIGERILQRHERLRSASVGRPPGF